MGPDRVEGSCRDGESRPNDHGRRLVWDVSSTVVLPVNEVAVVLSLELWRMRMKLRIAEDPARTGGGRRLADDDNDDEGGRGDVAAKEDGKEEDGEEAEGGRLIAALAELERRGTAGANRRVTREVDDSLDELELSACCGDGGASFAACDCDWLCAWCSSSVGAEDGRGGGCLRSSKSRGADRERPMADDDDEKEEEEEDEAGGIEEDDDAGGGEDEVDDDEA